MNSEDCEWSKSSPWRLYFIVTERRVTFLKTTLWKILNTEVKEFSRACRSCPLLWAVSQAHGLERAELSPLHICFKACSKQFSKDYLGPRPMPSSWWDLVKLSRGPSPFLQLRVLVLLFQKIVCCCDGTKKNKCVLRCLVSNLYIFPLFF